MTAVERGEREELPARREHDSRQYVIETVRFVGGVGRVDGTPGHEGRVLEVWLNVGKVGSALEALGHDAAIMASLLFQYGCPLPVLCKALTRNPDGTAAAPIGMLLDDIARGRV